MSNVRQFNLAVLKNEGNTSEMQSARKLLEAKGEVSPRLIPKKRTPLESPKFSVKDNALVAESANSKFTFISPYFSGVDLIKKVEEMDTSAEQDEFLANNAVLSDVEELEVPIEHPFAITIRALIKDELEAVDGYSRAIELAVDSLAYLQKPLADIKDEELVHIGELEKLLSTLNVNTDAIEDGKAEAEENLAEVTGDKFESNGSAVEYAPGKHFDTILGPYEIVASDDGVLTLLDSNGEDIEVEQADFELLNPRPVESLIQEPTVDDEGEGHMEEPKETIEDGVPLEEPLDKDDDNVEFTETTQASAIATPYGNLGTYRAYYKKKNGDNDEVNEELVVAKDVKTFNALCAEVESGDDFIEFTDFLLPGDAEAKEIVEPKLGSYTCDLGDCDLVEVDMENGLVKLDLGNSEIFELTPEQFVELSPKKK